MRPHVITIYSDGKPNAILAGRIDRARLHLRVGYLPIRPYAKIINFVYGAMRGDTSVANQSLFIEEICRSLSEGEADAAYLNYVKVDSPMYGLAKELPGFFRRDHFCSNEPHYCASIPEEVQDFYRVRSRKVRRNRKLYASRIDGIFGGDVEIRCFKTLDEVNVLMNDVEFVAKTTYQRGIGVGYLDIDVTHRALRLSAKLGWLRGYVLYLRHRPVAFLVGDLYDRTFFCDYMGYDPEYRDFTPGMYLTTQVLESLCGKEIVEVDFGRGAAQYKQMLGDNQWNEAAVYVFAETLKGLELNLINGFTKGINAGLKRTLGSTGLLGKVKKSWRMRAIPETQQA